MLQRSTIAMIVAASGLSLPIASSASVSFTFQDPSAALEMQYVEGDAESAGQLSYISPSEDAMLRFTVDASEHGIAPMTFDAILEIDLEVSTATDLGFGSFATVSGTFRFLDASGGGRGELPMFLEGTITNGAFFVNGTTGAQVSSSAESSLEFNAGPALQGFMNLGGLSFGEMLGSSFSMSGINLTGGGIGAPGINEHGYLESFNSNAAYVGNADIVPSPPTVLLLTALAAPASRRRRRVS